MHPVPRARQQVHAVAGGHDARLIRAGPPVRMSFCACGSAWKGCGWSPGLDGRSKPTTCHPPLRSLQRWGDKPHPAPPTRSFTPLLPSPLPGRCFLLTPFPALYKPHEQSMAVSPASCSQQAPATPATHLKLEPSAFTKSSFSPCGGFSSRGHSEHCSYDLRSVEGQRAQPATVHAQMGAGQ